LVSVTWREFMPWTSTQMVRANRGGVRGGTVHGAADEFGFAADDKKRHVLDLHATLLHLMGFDHGEFTYRDAGRDFRLTDVHGQVVKEILA